MPKWLHGYAPTGHDATTAAACGPRTGAPNDRPVCSESARTSAVSSFPARTPGGMRRVVAGISYALAAGRTLGVVGESGCGKSVTALALMGLVPSPGRVEGAIRFAGRELLGQSRGRLAGVARRGHRHGVPGADDGAEPGDDGGPADRRGAGAASRGVGWREGEREAVGLLEAVGINSPQRARRAPIRTSFPAACASAR